MKNPAILVPGIGGGDSIDTINQRLEEIAKISREDPRRYNKDVSMQKQRERLLQARDNLSKRASA